MFRFASIFLLFTCLSPLLLAADVHPYDSPNIYGQPVWIGEGEERFPAIYAEAAIPEPKGIVIMLHAAGEHPQWPVVIQLLREQLTDHGWNTLALQLPIPQASDRNLDRKAYIEMAGKKLQQAVNHVMPENPPTMVLLGHGLSANVILKRATERLDNNLLAVIGISINADAHQNIALNTLEHIQQLKLPILDLYAELDRYEVRKSAKQRKRAAKKAGNKDYRQLKIPGADHHFNSQSALLGSRVKSWLDATYHKQLKDAENMRGDKNGLIMEGMPVTGKEQQGMPIPPLETETTQMDQGEKESPPQPIIPADTALQQQAPANETNPPNPNPTGPEGLF